MQYKSQSCLLKNIYRILGGGFFLLLLINNLYGNSITFDYVYPSDLIINLNPNIDAGKAYIFWTSPIDGTYTLKYDDGEEKTALKDVSCTSGEEVRFYITSNSVTTATGQRYILDLQDGSYLFSLEVSSSSTTDYYSASFTITVDGTPPHPPTGLKAEPGDQGVKLEWTPPVDTDIESYFVYYSTYPNILEEIEQNSDKVVTTRIAGNLTSYYLSGLENDTLYYFVMRAVDYADNYSDFSSEVTATPRETYTLADLTGEEGGCFIATATYGSLNNPVVIIYRMFRDNFLSHFPAGRKFIKLYYRLSPHYVPFLYQHPLLRLMSFILLTIFSILLLIPVIISINPPVSLISLMILYTLFLQRR